MEDDASGLRKLLKTLSSFRDEDVVLHLYVSESRSDCLDVSSSRKIVVHAHSSSITTSFLISKAYEQKSVVSPKSSTRYIPKWREKVTPDAQIFGTNAASGRRVPITSDIELQIFLADHVKGTIPQLHIVLGQERDASSPSKTNNTAQFLDEMTQSTTDTDFPGDGPSLPYEKAHTASFSRFSSNFMQGSLFLEALHSLKEDLTSFVTDAFSGDFLGNEEAE